MRLNIRVAVIDDQDIIRLGIKQFLSEVSVLRFVGGFCSIEAFCSADLGRNVDVILLDDSLPDIETPAAIQCLQRHNPAAAVLLLGSRLTPQNIHQALHLGASGVVCKYEPTEDLLAIGIRHAHAGKTYLSPMAALIASRLAAIPALSQELREVLDLIAQKYTVAQMAEALNLAQRTVYKRRDRLRELLGVETNEQIVPAAIQLGLICPPED